ncbi:L,D-transpeptidase family protein [Phototrophicus methaneseepsis]|uniref:L,D-transpeptidase family protein n=1 Tax=Phototrophicus methaneseepsis TaxID=2710758 RepID=A0A7S8EBH5_9CHLR|nr:L,D-transpeptidase [Phototrophicus methaneseepsis]QPC83915.1 L,D-transpeptidase family protein [Phototrophicus methaneseepsis]
MNKRLAFLVSVFAAMLTIMSVPLFSIQAQDGTNAFATNTPSANSAVPTVSATQTPAALLTATPVATSDAPTATVEVPEEAPVAQVFEPEACRYVEGESASDECLAIIEEFPEPNVQPINRDGYTLEQYTFWRIGPHAVNAYDSPGGNYVRSIPEGFNFVNVQGETDAWIQNELGEWISKEDGYYVQASEFVGVQLPAGWNHPFGWILDTTGIWASTYPGGPATSESGLVPLHHERFNIYAEEKDSEGWTWYMVGPNQWVKQIYMTVIKPIERPEGVSGRWVSIDLYEQSLVAYEDDRPVFATLISTGLPGFDTNEGLFEVWARVARDGMSGATGAPDAYALESVPWVMYFDDSISMHGTYWHNFFGYRRSHGCVNLSISDARWIFEWTARGADDDGEIHTQVYVHSSGDYRAII